MKKINLLLFLSMWVSIAMSQSIKNNVKVLDFNLDVENKAVVITYNLSAVKRYKQFNIRVEGTLNGEKLNVTSLSKTSNIRVGNNLEVTWYASKDGYTNFSGDLGFNVIGYNPLDRDMDGVGDIKDKCPNVYGDNPNGCSGDSGGGSGPCLNLPATAGLGAIAATGTALLVAGASKSDKVKKGDLYKLLQDNTDPTSAVWDENGFETRQSAYDELNKDYKNGQYFMYGGLVVLVTAGTIWAIRKMKCRRSSFGSIESLRVTPQVRIADLGGEKSLDFGFKYTF